MSVTPVGGNVKELCTAAASGNVELMKYHLHTGMDPNYQHPEYMALPLAESIRYGHFEIAELLLSNGANASIIEMESGITTLEIAKRMGDQQVIDLLNRYTSEAE